MNDLISRQAAIDAARDWYEGLICGSFKGLEKRLRALPSAQPEQSIAQERYEDLCEYFKDCSDQGRSILTDRKEFKSWLDRMKWHVIECDKLGRELEKLKSAQPKTGKWIEHNPHKFSLGIVFECSECGEKIECEEYNYCPNCGCRMLKEGDLND